MSQEAVVPSEPGSNSQQGWRKGPLEDRFLTESGVLVCPTPSSPVVALWDMAWPPGLCPGFVLPRSRGVSGQPSRLAGQALPVPKLLSSGRRPCPAQGAALALFRARGLIRRGGRGLGDRPRVPAAELPPRASAAVQGARETPPKLGSAHR